MEIGNVEEVRTEMLGAAHTAAKAFLDEHYDGQDQGACGFSWITITPKHKGNTKLGRAERKVYRDLGFELDWTGKRFMLWNPADFHGQNIDCKEAGARAACRVLQEQGINASVGSRLD